MRPQCNLFQCSWCEREFIVDNAISFSGFDVCQPALESGKSVPTRGQINHSFFCLQIQIQIQTTNTNTRWQINHWFGSYKVQFTKLVFILHYCNPRSNKPKIFCCWSPPGGKNSLYQTFLCTSLLHRGMSGSQCSVVLVFYSKRSLLLVSQTK